jgi:plastocyanin
MKIKTIFLLIMISLTFAGCRSKEKTQQNIPDHAPAMSVNISRENCPSMEASVGMWLEWMNVDTVALFVQLRKDDKVIGESELNPKDQFSFHMESPGMFQFYCSRDKDTYATITVK